MLLIAVSARAQDYPAAGSALPQPSPLPSQDGTRQHLVGPHFDAQGKYVPQHYEATKALPFRGYFAADQAARDKQKQHGYAEPPADYTTPIDPDKLMPMEGR